MTYQCFPPEWNNRIHNGNLKKLKKKIMSNFCSWGFIESIYACTLRPLASALEVVNFLLETNVSGGPECDE